LGIGDWAQSPIPNPQSPIPNPQSPIPIRGIKLRYFNYFYLKMIIKQKKFKFKKIKKFCLNKRIKFE
jgi:hypothetical protein